MFSPACWFGRKTQPPPAPAPSVQLPVDPRPPQRIEPPPEIIVPPEPKPRVEAPPSFPKATQEEAPEPAPRQRRRTPTPVQPQPEAPAVQTPAAQVPQLAPVMTDGERRALDEAIDNAIARAVQNIRAVRSRGVAGPAKEMADQAESFVRQAQEIRKSDPGAAKSLAERAELLSREAGRR